MPPRGEGAGRIAAARAALVAALREQRTALEAQLFEQMRRSVGAYARLPVEDQQRVRRGVSFTIGLVLRLWEQPRTLATAERDHLRSLGTERVAMGVQLEEVTRGVDEAREAGWRIAVGATHDLPLHLRSRLSTDETIDLLGALSLELHRAVEAIREEIRVGFLVADRAARLARAQLYGAILAGQVATEEEAQRRAQLHGINLHRPSGLLLIAASEESSAEDLGASGIADTIPGSFTVVNHATLLAHRVVVVPCPGPANTWEGIVGSLDTALGGATVVPVLPTAGALPLRDAYLSGLETLRLARARFDRRGGVVRPGALAFIRMVAESAADRQRELLRPLNSLMQLGNATELVDTVAALLRQRGVTSAAKELNAHRNTVVARIAQIEARTGLNLDNADDRLVMAAALYADRLRGIPVS